MKKTPTVRCCIYQLMVLVLFSCHHSNNSPSETVRGIIAADNGGDIEKVLSFYTDDAMLIPSGKENISGKAAIRSNYEVIFLRSNLQLSPVIEEEIKAGRLAYVKGMIQGSVSSKTDASRSDVNDKFLMILKREAGRWKIYRLMWSR